MNSALTFLPAGVVTTYVMNQAAVPAEAFGLSIEPDDIGNPILPLPGQTLLRQAVQHGYPSGSSAADERWDREWESIFRARNMVFDPQTCPGARAIGLVDGCGPEYYDRWNQFAGGHDLNGDGTGDDVDLGIAYRVRWRQSRPPSWDPRAEPASAFPSRGAWAGIFAGSRSKTRIVNTFSVNDRVVGDAWYAHQLLQKPAVGLRGFGNEGPDAMFWGALPNTTAAEDLVWSSGPPISTGARKNTTRQWSELAYWFPSLTKAIGVVPLLDSGCGHSCEFSEIGSRLSFTASHSYLHELPLNKVWTAFSTISSQLRR